MQPQANNIEVSCFYLFVNYDELESPLQREFDALLSAIRESLVSNDIESGIKSTFDRIFRLRMLALRVINEEDENILELIEGTYPYFERLALDPKLGPLGENILFALRSNIRCAKALLGSIPQESIETGLSQIQDFDLPGLKQFIVQFTASSPTPEFSKTMTDWLESSLTFEYVILVGAMVKESKIELNENKIDILAGILAEATHTYNAIAFELGIFKSSLHISEPSSGEIDRSFVSEQMKLADADIKSFEKNWIE